FRIATCAGSAEEVGFFSGPSSAGLRPAPKPYHGSMASNMQKGKSLTDGKLTGQIIIDQLIRNVEMGQFEMAYSVLLPCVFSLYLHPEDYTRLSGVMELMKEDARRALSAKLAQLNARPLGFGLTRGGKDRK